MLQAQAPLLQGGTYSLQFDNQGAVYFRGGVVWGSSKPELQKLVVALLNLAADHNILLRVLWTQRAENKWAKDHYNHMVLPAVFSTLDTLWGPTQWTALLPQQITSCSSLTPATSSRTLSG